MELQIQRFRWHWERIFIGFSSRSSLPRLFRNAIDSRVYRCRGLKRDAWYVLTVACHVHAPVTPVKQRRLGRKPRLDRSIIPQKLVRRGQSCALEADRGARERLDFHGVPSTSLNIHETVRHSVAFRCRAHTFVFYSLFWWMDARASHHVGFG